MSCISCYDLGLTFAVFVQTWSIFEECEVSCWRRKVKVLGWQMLIVCLLENEEEK